MSEKKEENKNVKNKENIKENKNVKNKENIKDNKSVKSNKKVTKNNSIEKENTKKQASNNNNDKKEINNKVKKQANKNKNDKKEVNNKVKKQENKNNNDNKRVDNKEKKENEKIVIETKNEKQKSSSNILPIIAKILIGLVLIAILLFSVYKIINWNTDNQKTKEVMSDIKDSAVVQSEEDGKMKLDTTNIKDIYPNIIAWLIVNGTEIDYPIVQADDNSFYLSHSVDDSYNSAGWIFIDYNNKLDGTDKNTIIYGHNRRDGSQFGTMKNILNSDWYNNEENKYVLFVTEDECIKYEVFSVYKIEDEDYYITTSFRNGEFGKFVNTLKNRSIKDFGVDVSEDDSILTLSTCANNNKYRVVLHAKKIEE